MVVFGDKSTGKYVEVKSFKTDLLVHWVNYPSEIIYRKAMCSDQQSWLEDVLCNYIFVKCTDIFDARDALDEIFNMGVNVSRSIDEIQNLQNYAFDFSEGLSDNYWGGVFDALGWVLGDKMEVFEDV